MPATRFDQLVSERVAVQADGVPPLPVGEEDDHVLTIQGQTRLDLLACGTSDPYRCMRTLPSTSSSAERVKLCQVELSAKLSGFYQDVALL